MEHFERLCFLEKLKEWIFIKMLDFLNYVCYNGGIGCNIVDIVLCVGFVSTTLVMITVLGWAKK